MSDYCYLPLFLLAGLGMVFLFSRVLAGVMSIPTPGDKQQSERATRQAAIVAQKVDVLYQIRQWKAGTAPRRLWEKYYALEEEERAIFSEPETQASGRTAKARR